MKKILFAAFFVGCGLYSFAQDFNDLKRYSVTRQGGTARSMGMGGAIGAVGADYSSSSINPAALAQMRTNQAMISAGLNFTGTKSDYIRSQIKDPKFNFSIPNMGVVFSTIMSDLGKERKTGLINYSIAFGYNRINDFNRNTTLEANNNQSSYLDTLAQYATYNLNWNDVSNGLTPFFPEELALAAGAIVHNGNNIYSANLPAIVNMRQNYRIQHTGRQADWNVSFAGNFSHRLYVGAGIGVPGLRFSSTEIITEKSQDTGVSPDRSFELTKKYNTSGTGINAKLGFVFRVSDWLRIGAAYHTPTAWNLNDQYSYFFLARNFPNGQFNYTSGEFLATEPAEFSYKFTTPGKTILSAAFIFKKMGLLAIDYEYVDYQQAQTTTADLQSLNRQVRLNTQAASNLRIGGEYNYNEYKFRAGYAVYASPFNSTILNALTEGNLALRVYSIGAGYTDPFSAVFFDVAILYERYDDFYTPYTTETLNRPYYSSLNKVNSTRVVFTIGSRF